MISEYAMWLESRLFIAMLQRAPDGTHFSQYAYELEAGQSGGDIAQQMLDEFGPQAYAGMSERQVLSSFYANLWGQAPDAATLDWWVDRVHDPFGSVASVMVRMIEEIDGYAGSDSAKLAGQAVLNNKAEVAVYYASYGGNDAGTTVVLQGVTSNDATVLDAIHAMKGHWNIPANAADPAPTPAPPPPAPAPEPPPPAPAPEPPPAPAPEPSPPPPPPPPPPAPAPDPVVKHGLPEHAGDLAMLYLAYFGRPADWSGLDYYTSQSHFDLWAFSHGFSASPESQALYGTTFGATQVNAIYQNLFNRDAEAGGVTYWTNEVQAGHLTAAGAALGILLGAQGSDKVTIDHKLAAAQAFILHVDTQSEVSGYSGTAAAAEARNILHQVDGTTASLDQALGRIDALVAQVVAQGPHAAQSVEVQVVGVAPEPPAA